MIALSLAASLALLLQAAPPAPATSPAASARHAASPAAPAHPEIAAEVQRGITAYNAQDISYYEKSLAPDAVYIADDGAVFAGRERIVQLFTRIFGRTPKPRLEAANVVTGMRGDVAWARFEWTLSGIERARPGVATVLLGRSAGAWQVLSIQNTTRGHAARSGSPSPSASPAGHH